MLTKLIAYTWWLKYYSVREAEKNTKVTDKIEQIKTNQNKSKTNHKKSQKITRNHKKSQKIIENQKK